MPADVLRDVAALLKRNVQLKAFASGVCPGIGLGKGFQINCFVWSWGFQTFFWKPNASNAKCAKWEHQNSISFFLCFLFPGGQMRRPRGNGSKDGSLGGP